MARNERRGGRAAASARRAQPAPAVPDIRSARRHVAEGPDRSPRSPFERDRDRVLYSAAFRRLAGVTQVVHAGEGHVFHNRLTHSLKVAQVGRRLTEYLLSCEDEEVSNAIGLDPDAVETACLAHDIGHPPFGHIAEYALNELVEDQGGDGFEGNAQSFRVVAELAVRREPFGLNLTRASLNALLKYPWMRAQGGKESRKWGCFYDDRAAFQFARGAAVDARKSAEAELMDWSDDVAYSVHDLDDFYRAGLLPLDQLLRGGVERDRFLGATKRRWQEIAKQLHPNGNHAFESEAGAFFDVLGRSVVTADLQRPFDGGRRQEEHLDNWTSFLLSRYLNGFSPDTRPLRLNPGAADDPAARFVSIDKTIRWEVDLLKAMTQHYMWYHPALLGQQEGQRRLVRVLFEVFHEATGDLERAGIFPAALGERLAEAITRGSGETNDDVERRKARLAADAIAGLTEAQAIALYHRVTGHSPGTIRDSILR